MSRKRPLGYEDRLSRVCEYIQQNLSKAFTLDELSGYACCSKYHFNRLFSAYVGVSLFRFIQLMRLKRASYRLAFHKDEKIIDIAFDAGFENPESFSRAFKNAFDCSPSHFRKNPQWPQWYETLKVVMPLRKSEIEMNVEIIDFPATPVACLAHRGPVEHLMDSAQKFIAWRKESGLSPVKSSATYGVAYDDPMTTRPEDFRFDFCGAESRDIPENVWGVHAHVIPEGRCAKIRHLGPHNLMDDKIRNLYKEWLPQSGEELRDFPCFFHYINLISQVEEHELITDIYLPIR